MAAAGMRCATCESPMNTSAKFCSECGTPVAKSIQPAEYKHVTVLFADVVHSMDIAAAVGAERLREIMTDLVGHCAAVVRLYDGTVDKFTGDGLMAVFGAPVALEDHARRACLAALGLQEEARRVGADVRERDGVDLELRIGINSGQVIAGEMGSRVFGYTAIGEQVGMAQRMEAAAPPGGVMVSASTARLVEGKATLGEPEWVQIKGIEEPVAAHRLIGVDKEHRSAGRDESVLVGRRWEMLAVESLLDDAVDGHGAVVGLVGPPGIGKSRLVREVTAMADRHGAQVVEAFCESHTKAVPFHVLAALLRAGTGVENLGSASARARIRAGLPDAEPEDVLLFEDMLGIGEPDATSANITADARRRRLIALINAYSMARGHPAVYVIEDVHWIDEVSEAMLSEFLRVVPQTPSLALITFRPEYQGALSRVPGAHTIALAPLRDEETAALVDSLVGVDRSTGRLRQTIRDRTAGNPFFAEEIVRELAERGVLRGEPGDYQSPQDDVEVSVPATLQTTIAARIDRLDPEAKHTLAAAAVVGSRFGVDLLAALAVETDVTSLVAAQLVDQIKFGRRPEYVFRNPLVRAVALESQLLSERAELHRRLATAIQEHGSPDDNAALIAEHLDAAGDSRASYGWHMRAAAWASRRDIRAARASWERAAEVADSLPVSHPERTALRIAPMTMLCMSTWRVGRGLADTGFDELRLLCESVGDGRSLAIGMYGQIALLSFQNRHREASALASEQFKVLQQTPNSVTALGFIHAAVMAKLHAGEPSEAFEIAQWSIGLLEGQPGREMDEAQVASSLATTLVWGAIASCSLGHADWWRDMRRSIALQRRYEPDGAILVFLIGIGYAFAAHMGALVPDDHAVTETAEAVRKALEIGDDLALGTAYLARGLVLSHREADRDQGLETLCQSRDIYEPQALMTCAQMAKIRIAEMAAESGDTQRAIEEARSAVNILVERDEKFLRATAVTVLVKSLLQSGSPADVREAAAEVDRLAAVPTEPGFVVNEIELLRMHAMLADAHGDVAGYRDCADRYRVRAKSLGFEAHIAIAEAMCKASARTSTRA